MKMEEQKKHTCKLKQREKLEKEVREEKLMDLADQVAALKAVADDGDDDDWPLVLVTIIH